MRTTEGVAGAVVRRAGVVLSALTLCALASCGGGGGGGNTPSDASPSNATANGFSVTLDRSDISFTYKEGYPYVPPAIVNATPHGTLPKELYVLAKVEGEGISSYIPATFTTSSAQFRISPQDMPAGSYSGQILLYACADAQCAQPIGGTPLPVKYVVNVLKALKAPSRVDLSAISGQTANGNIAVQLPDGATEFSARVTQGSDWLTIGTPNAGALPISSKSLRSGTYYGSIELTSSGQVTTVMVTYQVLPPPGGDHGLRVYPSSLSFGAVENVAAPAQSVAIALPTWDGDHQPYQYSVQYSGLLKDWLTVTSKGDDLSVHASASQLSKGTYYAELSISHPADPIPRTIPITFTVGTSLIAPASQSLSVTPGTTAATLQGSTPINLIEGSPIGWTASSGAPWLKLTRAAGQTGTSVNYTVDRAQLTAMPNYSDVKTTVTVTPTLAHITPVSFEVSLRKQLPEPQFVGPYLLVSDKAQSVRVRGRGFNSMPSVSAYVTTEGITPVSIQRINDTQLVLQLPALKAGTYKIGIKNDLNLPANSVNLRVVAPQTFSYAAYPTSGYPFWMVYDAWRQSAYFLNKEAEQLIRYQFNGSTWQSSSVSIPAVNNVGIGPDGESLITLSAVGSVRLLSPDTLETQFQVDAPYPSGESFTNLRFGIPSTNDGRSWMTLGNGWNRLDYFDHNDKSLKTPNLGISPSFYGGPWQAMSRDGERMIIVQSGSISPAPAMLYRDSTDGVFKFNPAGLTFSYGLSLSDDGNRLALDSYEVRDGDFGVVGRLAMPDGNYSARTTVVSPDGKRTYVLTYPYEATYAEVPTLGPRVYVFDSSTTPTGSLYLPVLGYFDVKDYPSCHIYEYTTCSDSPRLTISPDGNTLFMVGNRKFMVVPVPALTPVAPLHTGRATAQSANRSSVQQPVSQVQRWPHR